jgi:hypothetical protein
MAVHLMGVVAAESARSPTSLSRIHTVNNYVVLEAAIAMRNGGGVRGDEDCPSILIESRTPRVGLAFILMTGV